MSDTFKDPSEAGPQTGAAPVPDHDAWFREQVELGLKEAKDAPEDCIPMEEVLKDLDL